jgi:alkanesulfonate monooxygenase SsuD/methylene tetrahydromethanopterin reductase-like flavin-dependent oxidoreductase (luciferase family)
MSKRKIRFSYNTPGPNPREAADKGVGAEKLGFDCVWVSDHLTDMPPAMAVYDAWTMLGDIGARTSVIRLGSGVTDIQRIHPAKVAGMMATLDHLTNGRVNLGIGAGEVMNTKPFGMLWEPPAVRVSRLKESLEVMKLLWGSSIDNPVSYSGEHYRLEDAHLSLLPVQKPHPPIYIGAFTSTKLFNIIGEMCQGWLPGKPNTEASFKRKVSVMSAAAERSGRSIDEIDVIASVPFAVSEKRSVREKAKQLLKKTLVFHTRLLKDLGVQVADESSRKNLEYQYIAPTADYANALRTAVEQLQVPDEVLDRGIDEMMGVGTLQQCLDSFEKFINLGATNIDPRPIIADQKSYEILSNEIIPYFKSKGS